MIDPTVHDTHRSHTRDEWIGCRTAPSSSTRAFSSQNRLWLLDPSGSHKPSIRRDKPDHSTKISNRSIFAPFAHWGWGRRLSGAGQGEGPAETRFHAPPHTPTSSETDDDTDTFHPCRAGAFPNPRPASRADRLEAARLLRLELEQGRPLAHEVRTAMTRAFGADETGGAELAGRLTLQDRLVRAGPQILEGALGRVTRPRG